MSDEVTRNNDALSISSMKTYAKENKLKIVNNPVKAAEAIRKFQYDEYGKEALALCEKCKYESNIEYTSCPYCGSDLGEPQTNKKTKKEKDVKVKNSKKDQNPKVKVAKKKGSKGKKKEEKSIAPLDPKAIEELKKRIDSITEKRTDLAKSAFSIGQDLVVIHDDQLFQAMPVEKNKKKQKKDEDGNPICYTTFDQFCEIELDFSRQMAYRYMAVARLFTDEEVSKIGVAKGYLIAKAPEDIQNKLKKQAIKGASRSKLEEMVRKHEGRTASPEKEHKEKETKKQEDDSTRPEFDEDENMITILSRIEEGDLEVPLLLASTGEAVEDFDNVPEADGVYAEVEYVSGVMLTITFNEEHTGLILSSSQTETEEIAE